MEEEFSDEADDGRGLSTEQVSFAKVAFVLQLSGAFHNSLVSVQVTQLMDMLCNETDVAELDIEVGHPQVMPLCCLTIQAKEDRTSDTHTAYVPCKTVKIFFICYLCCGCRWGAFSFMSGVVLMVQHLPALSHLSVLPRINLVPFPYTCIDHDRALMVPTASSACLTSTPRLCRQLTATSACHSCRLV